jgi:spermidine synthase
LVTTLAAVAAIAASLLMTELALTRIFSVVMYYHFAFLAISIALFGLSASGVYAYLRRHTLDRQPTDALLARQSLIYAACTVVALFALVRLRVGLNYSPSNLALMLAIYALAAIPFFTGGLVLTLAISRLASQINVVYAADLTGAAFGCLVLIPLLNQLGAPGVVLTATILAAVAAVLFASAGNRRAVASVAAAVVLIPIAGQFSGLATFNVTDTKGHQGDRVLFTKWNSFSRIGVYERSHGDWSLSPTYSGPLPETRFMDIDSAASTPIVSVAPDLSNAGYLRYELTSLAYHLARGPQSTDQALETAAPVLPAANLQQPDREGFTALVIGPGGGRDLASALVFGASRVDGVEINPIIANDVMRGAFRDFSGAIYDHPRVRVAVDDGRSFVRRSPDQYDVIQASLVDTWAATAAGAYTLTENTLYTVEAFTDYLDHLTDDGILTITRWVFDGLRLVSLAQEAGARRGWDAASHLAIVQHDRVATFLLKKSPFTPEEIAHLQALADRLRFRILYAPGAEGPIAPPPGEWIEGTETAAYANLIVAPDRERFYADYDQDIRPTTDDRPFFFHTTKLEDQFDVAFGRSMLFGGARRHFRAGAAGAGRRRSPGRMDCVDRLLRVAGRGVHADRGGHSAALRAAARAPGLFVDGDAVLAAARHRDRGGAEPALRHRIAPPDDGGGARLDCGARARVHARHRPVHQLGHPLLTHQPHPDRGRHAGSDWDAARHPDAGRHPPAGLPGAADGDVGVGYERRAVGRRRHPGHLLCDELGLQRHLRRGIGHLPGRPGGPPLVSVGRSLGRT